MSGLPHQLITSLRTALAECDQFESNRSLRSLFADTRLAPWRKSLPEADGISDRVDKVVSYLYDKKHRDGSYALVSLLMVLAETISPDDDRHEGLKNLTDQLDHVITGKINIGTPEKRVPAQPAGDIQPAHFVETDQQIFTSTGKRNFFISYNRYDKDWAEWIAWQLENAGYSTFLQAWDFRPGGNFVADMQEAAANSERTIAVLSQTYLSSQFTQPEWNAAFALDPTGKQGLLVPVKVRECDLKGLLSQIVYIDLTGVPADLAAERLLAGVQHDRAKPSIMPSFPGTVMSIQPPFPENL